MAYLSAVFETCWPDSEERLSGFRERLDDFEERLDDSWERLHLGFPQEHLRVLIFTRTGCALRICDAFFGMLHIDELYHGWIYGH